METEKPKEHIDPCPEQAIHIVLEDGRIQAVYASRPLARVDVEILDLDDTKASGYAELQNVRRSIAEAVGQCSKIY